MSERKNISLNELKAVVQDLNEKLKDAELVDLFHFEKKRFLFCLSKQQKFYYLLVRLDMPYVRAHLIPGRSSLSYDIQDRVPSSLFLALREKKVTSVSLYEEDRIIKMDLREGKLPTECFISLIPHKSFISVFENKTKIFGIDLPVKETSFSFKKEETFVDIYKMSQDYLHLEKKEAFSLLQNRIKAKLLDRIQKLLRQEELWKGELKETESIEQKRFEAHLLQANFHKLSPYAKEVELEDYKEEGKKLILKLDPPKPLQDQLEKRFQQIKKMEKRVKALPILIEENKKQIFIEQNRLKEFVLISAINELQTFEKLHFPLKVQEKKKIEPRLPYRSFETKQGFKILVGRTAKENDYLSFSVAHGNDLWFHVDGMSGSHVVLKVQKGKEVDSESRSDALQLAKHFSKAKDHSICSVVMTEAKYLHKQKGAPLGQVVLKKRTLIEVKKEEKRLSRLFCQKLPLL